MGEFTQSGLSVELNQSGNDAVKSLLQKTGRDSVPKGQIRRPSGGDANPKGPGKDCFSLNRLSLAREATVFCRKVRNSLGDPLPETEVGSSSQRSRRV